MLPSSNGNRKWNGRAETSIAIVSAARIDEITTYRNAKEQHSTLGFCVLRLTKASLAYVVVVESIGCQTQAADARE